VKEYVAWTGGESFPPREDVLRLQGIPPGAPLTRRIAALFDAAGEAYLATAEPRAIVRDIPREEFAVVYRGEGRNAAPAPLERIFPRADRVAAFAATVGEGVSDRIRACFDRNEAALAVMLDSIASAAADRLTDLLVARRAGGGAIPGPAGGGTLAYSPGYCGWHVSGQRALFAYLQPSEIGITLLPSFLMEPLKSVSGILVTGPAVIHRFPPDYPFCDDCRDRACRARIASLTGS